MNYNKGCSFQFIWYLKVMYTFYFADLTCSFDKLVSQCQVAMFRYCESKPEVPLYDPAFMRDFCEKNAPGLFDLLLKSITRDDNRVSAEREWLQRQRTVSLLHILSYSRFVIALVEIIFTLGFCWMSAQLLIKSCSHSLHYKHLW